MHIRTFGAVLILLAMPAAAQQLEPTRKDVQGALTFQSDAPYQGGDVAAWNGDLREALRRTTPDAAADTLAVKYGFTSAQMRRLVRAWVIAKSQQYGADRGWAARARAELYALAPEVRRTPLGLAILANLLDATTEDCTAEDFKTLMAGSTDPAADAYIIAANASCTGNFSRAASVSGDRAMASLIRAAEWGGLPPRDVLPLYAWLTSPAALARVRETDRSAVATLLWRRYLTALFDAGFEEQALALFDGLPADIHGAVVSPNPRSSSTVVVDGILMTFAAEDREGKTEISNTLADALAAQADALEGKAAKKSEPREESKSAPAKTELRDLSSLEAPILQLAEAMAIAGRDDEARRLLASLPGLAEAKAFAVCQYNATPQAKVPCPEAGRLPMGALPLDHLLNMPGADPYPIAETTLSGSGNSGRSASGAVLCRIFSTGDYPGICVQRINDAYFSDTTTEPRELAAAEKVLEQTIPGFKALRVSILGAHDVPGPEKSQGAARKTVAAMPPDFDEKPIPPEYRGTAKPVVLKGLAPLPSGFDLVRAERVGQRAIAISVSQTYDPTGEVSQGGYWVHVSGDGGKHWDRPLYTGLADRFPYVVVPASRLPLITGDALQLAVDVAEIDTASIYYPPVALRSRRRAKDLYLTIPLAKLRQDSDGDGLTDIAAHHLLLDRPKSGEAAPFVVGSDYDADCRVPPSPEKLALIDLLGRVTGASGAAIVEPVDRPAGQLMGGWRGAAAAVDQPLFLLGQREDYSCLTSKRLIIVYSQADIEAMEQFTPDFHALEIPRIIFNRTRDRGYVRWSTGWAGGTYRLRRVNGTWQFDTTSSWIT